LGFLPSSLQEMLTGLLCRASLLWCQMLSPLLNPSFLAKRPPFEHSYFPPLPGRSPLSGEEIACLLKMIRLLVCFTIAFPSEHVFAYRSIKSRQIFLAPSPPASQDLLPAFSVESIADQFGVMTRCIG